MNTARVLLAIALLATVPSTAKSQNGCVRLSWGTCDPWVENQNYAGPGIYTLVESAYGVSATNLGSDSVVRIRHLPGNAVPDAWRFDDGGCQTGTRIGYSNAAAAMTCPAMRGPGMFAIGFCEVDSDGSEHLRLVTTHNGFAPLPSTRYTLWQIMFDQSNTTAAPPTSGTECGGVELCENFSFDYANLLGLNGQVDPLPLCDQGALEGVPAGTVATWNGGCSQPVATQATTWGRVKSLYR